MTRISFYFESLFLSPYFVPRTTLPCTLLHGSSLSPSYLRPVSFHSEDIDNFKASGNLSELTSYTMVLFVSRLPIEIANERCLNQTILITGFLHADFTLTP
jgi:hypothetical protein